MLLLLVNVAMQQLYRKKVGTVCSRSLMPSERNHRRYTEEGMMKLYNSLFNWQRCQMRLKNRQVPKGSQTEPIKESLNSLKPY
jgi:hypothetical protein